jgi:tRNA modification GTPase
MSLTLAEHADTIVAIATAPGMGAIAVIRLSGSEAIAITDRLFKGKELAFQLSHTLHFGTIRDGDTLVDEVVVSLYKAPRSFTGEEVVEISCHGSVLIQQQIVALCVREGARLAKPGEFTQRAFLNGKMDLTQAEAVADLIASESSAAQQAAIKQLKGGFSNDLKALREELIRFSALIELELDFATEDVEFADRSQFYSLIAELRQTSGQLLNSFTLGNVIKNGVSVAIIGKPNAGKSTLLNALLNEERAIVSEIAGTTRDTIEETLNINGVLFRLIDTAGIREHTSDVIESIGVERSLEKMRQADVVVYLFDASSDMKDVEGEVAKLDQENLNYLLVGNKADMLNIEALRHLHVQQDHMLLISAKEKANIEDVKQMLYHKVMGGEIKNESTIVTNARHHAALVEVVKSLDDIKSGMDHNLPGDLLALDIRRCLLYLGEITGEVTTEDKLDYIFSKFCIGK